ncbi:MAG: hypothetical protein WA021_02965 [Minisyncoccia bacterium]
MLKQILIAIFAFILLALIVIWVISGGPRKVISETKESIASAVAPSEDVGFRLPWQPAQIFPTIDITDALNFADEAETNIYGDFYEESPEEQLAELEAEYDRLQADVGQRRTFGEPSRFVGKISIQQDVSGVRETDPRAEYIQIVANYGNDVEIDIAGWTLESALSGARLVIPPGASPYLAGSANALDAISLEPGSLALVVSAPSPIGISFQENMCTGYLSQFQQFAPPLSEECPSASSAIPLTEENLRRYGDSCFDVVANLPLCRFPQNLPQTVVPACRDALLQTLSYNGCVSQNRFRSGFQKNMWRVYLGASGELWRNSHDAIRLLDASGKTVSVFVY